MQSTSYTSYCQECRVKNVVCEAWTCGQLFRSSPKLQHDAWCSAVETGPLGGVEVPTATTVGADANEATITNTNPDRIGLADFTRNDGAAL